MRGWETFRGPAVRARCVRSLVSHNGTLGMTYVEDPGISRAIGQRIRCLYCIPMAPIEVGFSAYAGLVTRHPAVIGGALFRDFRRQRDDASVVVVKAA